MTEAPSITVVIPTRDRIASLQRCLHALARQETSRPFEVIVVDDASDPPVSAADIAACRQARLVDGGGLGPAHARNQGIAAAQTPVVLFTDDDTEPAAGWIEAAAVRLAEHPDELGVEGPIVSPPFDPLHAMSLENGRPGAYWTANVGYRRTVLTELGGFNTAFAMPHGEDLDLAFRVLERGAIGFAVDMLVTHFPREMSARDFIRRGRLARSEVDLFARHRSRFGRAARLPPRLYPVVQALTTYLIAARAQRAAIVRSPRRMLRFAALCGGHFAVTVATILRPSRR